MNKPNSKQIARLRQLVTRDPEIMRGTPITAWKRAAAPIRGLRFHDLCHQAITEMAEAGASDATLMAVAGWNITATERMAAKAPRWTNWKAV